MYTSILQKFTQHGIAYAAFGTWALKQLHPKLMLDYSIEDCDLLVDNKLENINKLIHLLRQSKWSTTLWNKPIHDLVTKDELKNKYYLRAFKSSLIIDITYEYPLYSWTEIADAIAVHQGISFASTEHILGFKRYRGQEKDLQVISILENTIDQNCL